MDEIGQKLRSARIEKGYTLDDLQQITKIQKRYLIAIEEGNFDALPGDFYVRAFIKQYADTVGIDSDALLTQFQQDIPDTQPQEYVSQSVENKTRATRAVENNPVNKLRRRLPQIALVVVGVLILAIVYYVTIANSRSNKETIPDSSPTVSVSTKKTKGSSSTSTDTSTATSKKKAAAASSKKKAADESSKKKASSLSISVAAANGATQAVTVKNLPSSGNKLTLSATSAAAWVSVIINGSTTWQSSLAAGSSSSVDIPDGTTTFEVKSGNALDTGIKLNGKTVDISDGSSVVRTITFTVSSTSGSAASSSSDSASSSSSSSN